MLDNVFTLDTAFVSMAVGLIVSFLLFWAPGVAPTWAKIKVKRLTLLALFLGVPLVITGLGCYTTIPIRVLVGCSSIVDPSVALTANIWSAIKIGFAGLSASQGGYLALLKWAPDLIHPAHLKAIAAKAGDVGKAVLNGLPISIPSVWDPATESTPFTTESATTRNEDGTGLGGAGDNAEPVDPTG